MNHDADIFFQMLAEEKANSEKLSAERDAAERDARQNETKVHIIYTYDI